jgi:hypothetical protein
MTSKIKVDNIENQCGGAVVTKCGATTTISGSVVKADDIQAADGGNLINQCGTTITLGASGDTINLASGASQTGFGRTGTVDWDTTPKTSTFSAVSGNGYFCNTSGGAFTVNLPAGSAGAIVSLADYAATWQTNVLTVSANGSEKIGGNTNDVALSTEGQSVTLVYVDSTQGWINTMDSTSNVRGSNFITATGGNCITTSGDYKIHVFTGPGTFAVSNAGLGTPCAPSSVEYLVVAGGGGGGRSQGGGGGGGGFRTYTTLSPASPLNAPAALPLSVTSYPITVGAGGTRGTNPPAAKGGSGGNSIFSTITSTGGGGGGTYPSLGPGVPGGSGGGGGSRDIGGGTGGTGNTPPVSPPQGNSGTGTGPTAFGGGGGGAGAAGGPGAKGGDGSFILTSFIGPTAPSYGEPGPSGRYFSGGGGGRPASSPPGAGGLGGGGCGSTGEDGTTNTGGGGGAKDPPCAGAGGSGIVIIRYKFQ